MRRVLWLLCLIPLLSGCLLTAQALPDYLNYLDSHPRQVPNLEAYTLWLEEPSEAGEALIPKFLAYAEAQGITVILHGLDLDLLGQSRFEPPVIFLNSRLGGEAKLATLIHELGHFCHREMDLRRTEGEIIAESVALLVLQDVPGIHSMRYSAAYILYTAPAGMRDVFLSNHRHLIQSCVNKLRGVL